MLRNKELSAAIANLQRFLSDPNNASTQQEKLFKAMRELKKVGRSGKLDLSRVFRATKLVTDALGEIRDTRVTEESDRLASLTE